MKSVGRIWSTRRFFARWIGVVHLALGAGLLGLIFFLVGESAADERTGQYEPIFTPKYFFETGLVVALSVLSLLVALFAFLQSAISMLRYFCLLQIILTVIGVIFLPAEWPLALAIILLSGSTFFLNRKAEEK